MTWTDKLSVGVGVIDDDHKKLVGMVNELYDAMQAGHGKEKLGRILDELVKYTNIPFRSGREVFC
jgi:hemerythrin